MQIWHGQEGLNVYEEIHQNFYNELTHLIFLPGVFYGTFRGVPALLNRYFGVQHNVKVILAIMTLYSSYYACMIDIVSGLTTFLSISPYACIAIEHLDLKDNHIKQSLTVASASLVIQEVLGHTLFEEVNSRLTVDYVFNAIMFSPLYYAVNVHKIIMILQFYIVLYFI